MNIYTVKKYLSKRIGKIAKIKYSLGRNKYETYIVKLDKLYSNIFTVLVQKKDTIELKSFSYNDIVMRQLKIDFKE
jgi:uncharacterized protein Veg